jgi:ribonuclease T
MHSASIADRAAELFISVDIEASGPVPGSYSMLAIGACIVGDEKQVERTTYYAELSPISDGFEDGAMRIVGRPLAEFTRVGRRADVVMREFRDWILLVAADKTPVFVGFNASFDWSFVNWYFHKYVGENPFGVSALDIKSYYMGLAGASWRATRSSEISRSLKGTERHTHQALADAIEQAAMLEKMFAASRVHRQE